MRFIIGIIIPILVVTAVVSVILGLFIVLSHNYKIAGIKEIALYRTELRLKQTLSLNERNKFIALKENYIKQMLKLVKSKNKQRALTAKAIIANQQAQINILK